MEAQELDLRELKSEVFYDQIGYLSEELGDPERYFPSLKARGVLDETDCEIIRAKVTSREKADAFVETVHKRESSTGEPAFDVFVDLLLIQIVQAHIARALQQAFTKRKAEAGMAASGRERLADKRQLSKSVDELSILEPTSGLESLVRQAPVDCHENVKQTGLVGNFGANGVGMTNESFPTANGGLGYPGSVPIARRPFLQKSGVTALHHSVGLQQTRTFSERHHGLPATRDDQYLFSQSLHTHQFQQFGAGTSAKARSLTRTGTRTRKLSDLSYSSGRTTTSGSVLSQQSIDEAQEEEAAENYGFECSICMEKYEDEGVRVPRNLACGHTYCTGCLQKMLPASQYEASEINCPTCHTATSVPEKNVEKLSKNFGLLEVITGQGSYGAGSELRKISVLGSPLVGHRGDDVGSGTDMYCEEHRDHLSSFCVHDGVLVCSSCLLFGSHKHHQCLLVNEAAKSYREKFRQLAPEVSKQQKKMEAALAKVQMAKERVIQSGQRLEAEVETELGALLDLIEERRRQLKVEVMQRTQARVEALLDQESELRENIEKASVAYHSSSNLLRGDDFSLLKGCSLALDQVEGVFINPPPTTPRANDDLVSQFSSELREDIASQVEGYGSIMSEAGVVESVSLQPYHDGIRVTWDGHNYTDNVGISYHLQMSTNGGDFMNMYRGGNTKFTWKSELEPGVPYRFRVQVRTTEGVGNWSTPAETMRVAPAFHWHDTWRNVKIDLSRDKLEASWAKGAVHNYWATFAGDRFYEQRQHYVELEIVDLGKHPQKPSKRLAIGVIACSKDNAGSVPWQDGKCAIGQWKDVPSWAFHPISGVLNSTTLPAEGKSYSPIKLQIQDRIGMLVDMDGQKVTFFCNGQDLGVAFEGIEATSLLPAVSIKDKIRVRLRFPPPPYACRKSKLVRLSSGYHFAAKH